MQKITYLLILILGLACFKRDYDITILAPTTTLSLAFLENNMVIVPGGRFTMGCTIEQAGKCDGDEYRTQKVTLSSYKICRFEVTQQLWVDVMGSNPSTFTDNLQRPVDQVSWNDCQAFITKLNQMTDKNYRLPTEAEWEYAARGGASSTYSYIYSGSNNLNNVAWWYGDTSCISTPPIVGVKEANALGLFDMSGNVEEWCNDRYGNYSSTAVNNPFGANFGEDRVARGGNLFDNGNKCRVSARSRHGPSFRYYFLGLRLCLP